MATEQAAIGRRVRRTEDPDLVTGHGRYAADHAPEGVAHLVVLRSPFGRARIDRLDLDAARAHPGVLAAWSAADLPELAAGMEDPAPPELAARPRPVLARVTPTEANPEGIKGAGESGTVPVPAAICAAVERALAHVRPEVVVGALPVSPERVVRLARGDL